MINISDYFVTAQKEIMHLAPPPEEEVERLIALHETKILDTPSEERYERIVDLAASYFKAPICFISFVDSDRQWIKAGIGITFKQSERSESICTYTIAQEEPLIIDNIESDFRFNSNKFITCTCGIKSYVGIQIKSVGGHNIGSFCIANSTINQFTNDHIKALENFGKIVEDEMNLIQLMDLKTELLKQKREKEKKNALIESSLRYARIVQEGLLQYRAEMHKIFPETIVFNKPKDIVTGDFYLSCKKGKYNYLTVADCTGHGIPGGLISIACNKFLKESLSLGFGTDVGKILDHTNSLVKEQFSRKELREGMDLFMFCLDTETNELYYSGANSPAYLIKNTPSKVVNELKVLKQPIGNYITDKAYPTYKTKINPGDIMVLCSDGFQDQFGGDEFKKYGKKRFKELLAKTSNFHPSVRYNILESEFNTWKGREDQIDDVMVLLVKF